MMVNEVLGSIAGNIFSGFTTGEKKTNASETPISKLVADRAYGVGAAIKTVYEQLVEANRLTPKQTEDVISGALKTANESSSKSESNEDLAKHSQEEALLKEIAENTKRMAEAGAEKVIQKPLVSKEKPGTENESAAEDKVKPEKTTKELIREIIKDTVIGKSVSVLNNAGPLGRFASETLSNYKEDKNVANAFGSTVKSRVESLGPLGKITNLIYDDAKKSTKGRDEVRKPAEKDVESRKPATERFTTSSGLSTPPQKKTKLASEILSAFKSGKSPGMLSTVPYASTKNSIIGAIKNIAGGISNDESNSPVESKADSSGGLLSTLANVDSIATAVPRIGAILPGLAAAGSTALAGAGVAAAGAAGYGLGTLIQPSVDKFFGGESGSIGSRIYDWLNPSEETNTPTPAKVKPQLQVSKPPLTLSANPTSVQSEINTAMAVSEKLAAAKSPQQQQPIVISNSNNKESTNGPRRQISIRNTDSSFERVQMNDYWPARIT